MPVTAAGRVARRVLKGYRLHKGYWPTEYIPAEREEAWHRMSPVLDVRPDRARAAEKYGATGESAAGRPDGRRPTLTTLSPVVPQRRAVRHYGGMAWTWAQTAALLAGVTAVAGALISAALTYNLNQRAARRERQTNVFAEALTAIEDYAELPYRIRRRPGTPDARHELTEQVSRIQSRIAFHQAWLSIEAPSVARSYDDLVRAAKKQAGNQMKQAWREPATKKDSQVSLGTAFPRDEINAARHQCIAAMREALGRRPLRPAAEVIPGHGAEAVMSSAERASR